MTSEISDIDTTAFDTVHFRGSITQGSLLFSKFERPVLAIGFGPPSADFGSIWSDLSFFINFDELSINSLKMGSFLTGGIFH